MNTKERLLKLIANLKSTPSEFERDCGISNGRLYKEEWRVIKDIAFDFWKEIVGCSEDNEYLFSVGLIPGSKTIRREQITRRRN